MNHAFLLPACSLLFASHAWAGQSNVVFSGQIERVTNSTISVLLSDGRIIESRITASHGELSPGSLAKHYVVGDRVEITCTKIPGLYDSQIGRRLFLDLRKLRPLQEPSDEERSRALASKAWRQSPNLLETAGAAPPIIEPTLPGSMEQIRAHILEFVAEMPNFVADEVAKRYVSVTHPPDWRLADTIESEITFHGNTVSRDHILVNGKSWTGAYRTLPGFKWTDGFGSQLKFLFDDHCPTQFRSEGRLLEDGTAVSVVSYSSPAGGCEFYWQDYQQFYPAKTGRIVLDAQEERVIRLETQSAGFPEAFPIASVRKQVTWNLVTIGDAVHWLPIAAEIQVVRSNGEMRLARHEYKNHRHFEAASTITFHEAVRQ